MYMKLPKLPKLSILLILVTFLGCSTNSDNEDIPSNNGPESLVLTSDKLIFEVGETATFSVVDDQDNNITSESTILVDGVAISGSTFTPADAGIFEIKAAYLLVESNVIDITANATSNLPASFSKKAVVEDFTGTWCGWCPRVSYAASLVEEQTDKVFVVGVHNGDQMANGFGNALENMYNITGFPTAYIDRANTWTYPEPNNVSQALNAAQGTVDVGLAIETSLTGSNLDITISQGFLQNMTNVKLLVFVLEDGILADQSNNTSYYGGANNIIDFEHNGVLRYVATDIMGDTTTSTIGIHEQSFSVNLSSQGVQDPTKTGVLAMLVDDSARVLYNAQYVISGQTQDFD